MKVFVSMPMKDMDMEEIQARFENDVRMFRKDALKCGMDPDKIEFVNGAMSMTEEARNNPLQCLAISLMVMSKCDAVAFAPGWRDARGCLIEHECAVQYGLEIVPNWPYTFWEKGELS